MGNICSGGESVSTDQEVCDRHIDPAKYHKELNQGIEVTRVMKNMKIIEGKIPEEIVQKISADFEALKLNPIYQPAVDQEHRGFERQNMIKETLKTVEKSESRFQYHDTKLNRVGQYTGSFNENMREGKGIMRWEGYGIYDGDWRKDKANGIGILHVENKGTYYGEWVDDMAEGLGVYYYADGSKYQGWWKNDKQNGFGKEIWPDGSVYSGHFKNGMKDGEKGKFDWADGTRYEGDFKENKLHGTGTYWWQDGRKYTGEWADNEMHGHGEYLWPGPEKVQKKYIGEFLKGKKHGKGRFFWGDGRIYDGEWKDGRQYGEGKIFMNEADKKGYEGVWNEEGKITWKNGNEPPVNPKSK